MSKSDEIFEEQTIFNRNNDGCFGGIIKAARLCLLNNFFIKDGWNVAEDTEEHILFEKIEDDKKHWIKTFKKTSECIEINGIRFTPFILDCFFEFSQLLPGYIKKLEKCD